MGATMSEDHEAYAATPEIDDLDVWLGELHSAIHAWLFAAGRDRANEHAEMMKAEQAIRDLVLKLRADVERIGRERDDMARANAELQARLSAYERHKDDLK
jgi:hypothetical protein